MQEQTQFSQFHELRTIIEHYRKYGVDMTTHTKREKDLIHWMIDAVDIWVENTRPNAKKRDLTWKK